LFTNSDFTIIKQCHFQNEEEYNELVFFGVSPPFIQKLCDVSRKWLVNLSNVSIPGDVQDILKLGEKFSIPIQNKKNSHGGPHK
jgi:hypothetical protein